MSSVRPEAAPSPAAPATAEVVASPAVGAGPSLYRMQVSLSGVYVETDQDLAPGAIVTLQITLPRQQEELKTVARVSYRLDEESAAKLSRKPGIGMELLDIWGSEASASVERALTTSLAPEAPSGDVLVGAKVLIVDDDQRYRQAAGDGMREAGCKVITASNGIEGLSMAVRENPELIITDVTMPGLDGWQLLRLLRTKKHLRGTPVIFLTDLKDDADRLRGYRLGVDDYLAKPFTAEELVVRARRAVERVAASYGSGGLRGKLSEIPLATLLTLAEMERRSATIQLGREGERAQLYVIEGQVHRIELDARHDHLVGIERFFYVLDWTTGQFELGPAPGDEEDVLQVKTTFALLEHARRNDEG